MPAILLAGSRERKGRAMEKRNGNGNQITALRAAIFTACFAGATAATGCEVADEEPIPQALSQADLVPDKDNPSVSSTAPEADDGPNPSIDITTSAQVAGYRYDREKARSYIERYALSPNRQLAYCALNDGTKANCTNFASQVLWQGGVPMQYTNSDNTGWWYRYSCLPTGSSSSWRQVNRLLQYLVTETNIGEFKKNARDLKLGDLIFYRVRHSSDGYSCNGNLFNHTTVVSGFDSRGEPLVSYHSNDALNVPWNAKAGSRGALGEACAFGFVHIRD